MTLIRVNGPAVVVSARTAAWIELHTGLTALRVRVRGTDLVISRELEEVRRAAMLWRASATGSPVASKAEVSATSEEWFKIGQAADLIGVTDRAIRMAWISGRLQSRPGGRPVPDHRTGGEARMETQLRRCRDTSTHTVPLAVGNAPIRICRWWRGRATRVGKSWPRDESGPTCRGGAASLQLSLRAWPSPAVPSRRARLGRRILQRSALLLIWSARLSRAG